MKNVHKIILAVSAIVLLSAVSYFAFYLPNSREALASNQQACANLETVFKQNYAELNATSSIETKLDFENHFSTTAGKCYIKVQRHDNMEYSYTSDDKTILYDAAADKSVASCVTVLEKGTAIDTQCTEGNKKITQQKFSALEQEYMQR
jgi:hypothetical protein